MRIYVIAVTVIVKNILSNKSFFENREINDKNNTKKRAIESMTGNSMKYITGWGME